MIRDQRYWPKFGEHTTVEPNKLDLALRLAFNGIYDIHDAFSAQMATATLHATVNAGVVTVVDVLTAGSYTLVPTIKAVGGGGAGATFKANLNTSGGIASVTIVSGGAGYTSPPALVVTGS